ENIYKTPNLPAMPSHIYGWACNRNAVLVASAPIAPTEDVRAVMSQYDMAIDPESGMVLEYRRFGSAQKDVTSEFVECNYGYAPGNPDALVLFASAAS
ncbi:MAG: hypothetical protein U1F98_06265, partial [Verrucomicrobiota bacterium]